MGAVSGMSLFMFLVKAFTFGLLISLIWMSVQDFKTKSVSLLAVGFFGLMVIGLLYLDLITCGFEEMLFRFLIVGFIGISLMIGIKFFESKNASKQLQKNHIIGRRIIGRIDIVILILLMSVVDVRSIPIFLILTGIGILILHGVRCFFFKNSNTDSIPMVPAIALSYVIVVFYLII